VSNPSVTRDDAHPATDSSSTNTTPLSRELRRMAAENRLAELERAVKDIARRWFEPTELPPLLQRRSRRSAWFPSDWP
jgi:hypothetical protein